MSEQEKPRKRTPGEQMARVNAGEITLWMAERELNLQPGEYLAPTGVVMGHNARPGVPRFGADETDLD
jgi:quercetin dioxygenase-like cupin family protein